jgi:hypothetical protein
MFCNKTVEERLFFDIDVKGGEMIKGDEFEMFL